MLLVFMQLIMAAMLAKIQLYKDINDAKFENIYQDSMGFFRSNRNFSVGRPFIFGIPAGNSFARPGRSKAFSYFQGFHLVLSAQTAHGHRLFCHLQERQNPRVRPHRGPGKRSRKKMLVF